MAKKRQKQQNNNKKQEDKTTLLDHLDSSVLQKLKDKKNELKIDATKKEEEEAERRRIERKQREKNKSFEELFNESNLNWKNFK